MNYEIQRYDPRTAKPIDKGWVLAYGLKRRSWPRASSEEDAIARFKDETARARSPMRLICWGGTGYSARFRVIAINRMAEANKTPGCQLG